MTNAHSLFRSLIIYGICLPLAIFVGYLLANPLDLMTFATVGLLLLLFMVPLLLRWHYPWLVLAWNSTAGLYFLPGKPSMVLVMVAISFGISVLSYIMNRNLKFISVPSVSWPLFFITAVVLATAQLTGGIGLNVLGSSGIGGKRYLVLLSAIIGFFALTARRIPAEKAGLYVNMFFLGALSSAVSQITAWVGPSFYFIYLIFPAGYIESGSADPGAVTVNRLDGLAVCSVAIVSWLLARHGLGGLLNTRHRWRQVMFFGFMVACLFGGFRSMVITLGALCIILFWQEGLIKSRILPIIILGVILLGAFIVPFASKLPLAVQRSLTFLPLKLDIEAEMSANASTDWRVEMWKGVIPQIPRYLILGKGLAIDSGEFDMMTRGLDRGQGAAAGSALAGDYHNGPLSLIIPFGIFGVIGFIWFLVASTRVLHQNYRFGDPTLERVNRFLFTSFVLKSIMFFVIFGSFYADMLAFVGLVGLSVALNGGVRGPLAEPIPKQTFRRFKLADATQ